MVWEKSSEVCVWGSYSNIINESKVLMSVLFKIFFICFVISILQTTH